jgi:hypothetical protein
VNVCVHMSINQSFLNHLSTHFKRYILLFSIALLLIWTVKPSTVNSSAQLKPKDFKFLVQISNNQLPVLEKNKIEICHTAARLYQRGIKDRRLVTWDEIFISLELLFSRNNKRSKRTMSHLSGRFKNT